MFRLSIVFLLTAVIYVALMLFVPSAYSGWLLPIKVLPILLLLHAAVTAPGKLTHKQQRLLVAALIFSMAGDIAIHFVFVGGIGAFFVAQICYLLLFASQFKGVSHRWLSSLLVLAYICTVGWWVIPQAGDLLLPLSVYMSAISLMVLVAVMSRWSMLYTVVGAMMFVISDSLIAIDRFYGAVPIPRVLIMCTYYLAQYWLVRGFTAPK